MWAYFFLLVGGAIYLCQLVHALGRAPHAGALVYLASLSSRYSLFGGGARGARGRAIAIALASLAVFLARAVHAAGGLGSWPWRRISSRASSSIGRPRVSRPPVGVDVTASSGRHSGHTGGPPERPSAGRPRGGMA